MLEVYWGGKKIANIIESGNNSGYITISKDDVPQQHPVVFTLQDATESIETETAKTYSVGKGDQITVIINDDTQLLY